MSKKVLPLLLFLALAGCSTAATTSTTPATPGQVISPARPSQTPEKTASSSAIDAIKSGTYTVIDVRTPSEFSAGHVKGAKNIDIQAQNFVADIRKLPKNGKYVVYCKSGNRSANAQQIMKKEGFTEVLDGGGFEKLKAAGVATQ